MLVMGCDIGALFTKAVIMDDENLLASKIIRTPGNLPEIFDDFQKEILRDAGITSGKQVCRAGTGKGVELLAGFELVEDIVTALGVASAFYLPEVELVLDLGGQSITAILLNKEGEVLNFMRNDKCASGSGRFLELMSERLKIKFNELDLRAQEAVKPVELSTQCGVFAESEVISLLNLGEEPSNIIAGVCASVANLVVAQGRKFGPVNHYTLTGGVALFNPVVKVVKEKLTGSFHPFPHNPQLAGAIGVALLAGSDWE